MKKIICLIIVAFTVVNSVITTFAIGSNVTVENKVIRLSSYDESFKVKIDVKSEKNLQVLNWV